MNHLRVVGWGPFRLPGERRRHREMYERARQQLGLPTAPRPGRDRGAVMSYWATDCDRCYYGYDKPCVCVRECNSELCAVTDEAPATDPDDQAWQDSQRRFYEAWQADVDAGRAPDPWPAAVPRPAPKEQP